MSFLNNGTDRHGTLSIGMGTLSNGTDKHGHSK